jgi:polyisoprenoid-binding protein YceI
MNTASDEMGIGGGSAVGADADRWVNAERWVIDAARSRLAFSLRHIVLMRIRGEFLHFGGTVFIDQRRPYLSSAEVWIDLASVTTGEPERDTHVRSPEFLNVAQFPQALFKSEGVDVRGSEVVIDGRLDLHGIVHDVEVRATFGLAAAAGPDEPERRHFTVRGSIDRQSFGLHWNQDLDVGGVVVGDEVVINGEIELVKAPRSGQGEH